ncbi:hypothetical protein EPI10_020314 [Gossypium australe]|uniref:Uncharacterized protein n=1 Tax=Gossypium australe TaxID=47621 RepID=A0A5B6WEJ5_9ROSI|nr:hypothetical protein EPI10_020314 [Gossypium australe]
MEKNRFELKGKLSLKFIRLYEILERLRNLGTRKFLCECSLEKSESGKGYLGKGEFHDGTISPSVW